MYILYAFAIFFASVFTPFIVPSKSFMDIYLNLFTIFSRTIFVVRNPNLKESLQLTPQLAARNRQVLPNRKKLTIAIHLTLLPQPPTLYTEPDNGALSSLFCAISTIPPQWNRTLRLFSSCQ